MMESNVNSSSSSTTPVSSPTTSSSSSFLHLLLNQINHQDVRGLLNIQQPLLDQLDKTNEKLDGINRLSAKRYLDATRDFSSHTQVLTTMKNDLDAISKRIRALKTRLNKKYPEAYTAAVRLNANQGNSLDEDEDDDIDELASSVKTATSASLVKSRTVDCSQISSSLRESHSLSQLSTHLFDIGRRSVQEKPSGADAARENQ